METALFRCNEKEFQLNEKGPLIAIVAFIIFTGGVLTGKYLYRDPTNLAVLENRARELEQTNQQLISELTITKSEVTRSAGIIGECIEISEQTGTTLGELEQSSGRFGDLLSELEDKINILEDYYYNTRSSLSRVDYLYSNK